MIPKRPASGLPAASARATAVSPSPDPAPAPAVYRVRAGDTLFSIARRFGTTVGAIKQLNSLTSDRIAIGDRLTLR
jgi:membrane-bound lytic murein transglycosylase D